MSLRTLLLLAASVPSLVLAQESMCSVRTVVVPVVVTTTIGGPADTTTMSSGGSGGSNSVVVSTSTGGTVIPVPASSSSATSGSTTAGGSTTAAPTFSSTTTQPTLTLSSLSSGYSYGGSSVGTSGSVVQVVETIQAPPVTAVSTVTGDQTVIVSSTQYAVSRAMFLPTWRYIWLTLNVYRALL